MNKIHNVLVTFLVDEAREVLLQDRFSVPTKRVMTDAGQMHVPCRFARTGEQLYTAGQLGLSDRPASEVIAVIRDEATVFDEASMATFRSAPVTLGHPKDGNGKPIQVTAENAKELQVGVLEGMPVRDEDTLAGILVLTTKEAIDAIENDQELSAGYICDIEEIDGKFYQRNIRANHIAIVNRGRAGSSCRISDEAIEVFANDGHPQPMPWDFGNEAAYKQAFKSWIAAEYIEYFGSADAEGKAGGNVGTTDEALQLQDELASLNEQLSTQKELVADFKEQTEALELANKKLEVQLNDAQKAAKEDVIERCQTIEYARLIADMRIEDLLDKSTPEIKRLVVSDQNPKKDYSEKKEAFIDAMFEILVDASKGETPMGKLFRNVDTHVTVDSAQVVDKVAEARNKMIQRNANLLK